MSVESFGWLDFQSDELEQAEFPHLAWVSGRALIVGYGDSAEQGEVARYIIRWDLSNTRILKPLSGYGSCTPDGVTSDGTIFGSCTDGVIHREMDIERAAVWFPDDYDEAVELVPLPGHNGSGVRACSKMTKFFIGFSHPSVSSSSQAVGSKVPVFWYETDSSPVELPIPDDCTNGFAACSNATAKVIGGHVGNVDLQAAACVWYNNKLYLLDFSGEDPTYTSVLGVGDNGLLFGTACYGDDHRDSDEAFVRPWIARYEEGDKLIVSKPEIADIVIPNNMSMPSMDPESFCRFAANQLSRESGRDVPFVPSVFNVAGDGTVSADEEFAEVLELHPEIMTIELLRGPVLLGAGFSRQDGAGIYLLVRE